MSKKAFSFLKKEDILLFCFFFVLTFVLFGRYILENLIPLSGDGCGYLNLFFYGKSSVEKGLIPLWNPYMNAGKPFAQDFTSLFFYPFRIILSFLNTKWMFYAFYACHLALGSVYFKKFVNVIGCSSMVSYTMSIVYYFSINLGGYRKSHLLLIACTIYLPVILYYIEKYYRTGQSKFLYVSSLFMVCQFLVGFPQYALYTDIAAGLYLIALAIVNRVDFWKWIKEAIVWGMLYIGMAMFVILPYAELIKNYTKDGAVPMTLEQFRTYSIHPVKLAMMLCPTIFRSNPFDFSSVGSSEMDIEIFLGTVAFVLMVYGFLKCYRNKYIILSGFFMMITFIYAMNGTSEFLSRIVYHIPLLNAFRCSARILFVFTFFGLVIVAEALDDISQRKAYVDFHRILFGCIIFLLSVSVASYAVASLLEGGVAVDYVELGNRYRKSIIVLLIAVLGVCFLRLNKLETIIEGQGNLLLRTPIVTLCTLLIVIDVYPFWKISATYSMDQFGVDNGVERFLVDHREKGKVILANPYIDGAYSSVIAFSFALSLGIQGINSYASGSNPRLSRLLTKEEIMQPSFNFSGLYTGFPMIAENVKNQNDILSMLGVRYIIDQEGIVPPNEYIDGEIKAVKKFKDFPDAVLSANQETAISSFPIAVKSNKDYSISFDISDDKLNADEIYIDFYGGELYDEPNQQRKVEKNGDETHYEIILNTGEIPEGVEDIVLRFVGINTTKDIEISNIVVDKVKHEKVLNPYQLVFEEDGVKIYENNNCKDLLYASEKVVHINRMDNVYQNERYRDFDKISYVEDLPDMDAGKVEVADIRFNGNRAKANVKAKEDSFLNFSQAMYPGWRAYIDGKRVADHEVNGYIQGVAVPKGAHQIVFKFVPVSLYLGLTVSGIAFLIWAWLVFGLGKKAAMRGEEVQ